MMSNRSAFSQGRFLGYQSKRYIYLLLVFSLLSMLLGPMINFIVLKREFSLESPMQQLTREYVINNVAQYFQTIGAFVPYFLAGLLGIVFALVFSFFLQTKKQANFFHALPVKRSSWLTYQYLIGFLFFTIINLLMLLGNIALLLYLTGVSAIPFDTLLIHFFQAELFFLTSYAISILAGQLVGNLLAQVAMIATLQFGITALGALILGYMSTFFRTFIDSAMAERLIKFSLPSGYLTYLSSLDTTGQDASVSIDEAKELIHLPLPLMSIQMLVSMALVTILCIALSYVAYRWRAMERVSETLVFRKLKFILKLYFGLLSAAGLGLIFYNLSANSLFFLWAGVVFGLILCHFFFEMAINRDVRAMLRPKYWLSTALILVLSSGFCLIFIKDVFGYDTYVPKDASVASVRLVDDSNGLNITNNDETMVLKDRDNIIQTVKIAQLGVKYLNQVSPKAEPMPITKDVVEAEGKKASGALSDKVAATPELALQNEPNIGVDIYYTLASGSKISRRYNIPQGEYFKHFKSIYESKAYRNLSKEAIKTMMESPDCDFQISEDLFNNLVLEFTSDKNLSKEDRPKTTKADLEALKKALIKDIDQRTLDNYGKNVVATISGSDSRVGRSWVTIWVTKQDKATYAFLKDMEAKKHTIINQSFYFNQLPEFKSLTIVKVDEDGNKRTTVKTIKDKKTIATLLREDTERMYTGKAVDGTYVVSGETTQNQQLVDRAFLPGKVGKYLTNGKA